MSGSSSAGSATNDWIKDATRHLENLARDFRDAQNQRNFSISSPIWTENLSAGFTSQPEFTTHTRIGIEQYLLETKAIFEAYPDMRVDIDEVNTIVDHKTAKASVYMNLTTSEWPPGMLRRSIGILEFEFTEQKWLCVGYKGFTGMGEE